VWIDGKLVRKEDDAYEALLFEVFDRGREARRAAIRAGVASGAAFESEFRKRVQDLWKFDGVGDCGVQQDESADFAGFRLAAPDEPTELAAPPQIGWRGLVEDSFVDPETGETREGC